MHSMDDSVKRKVVVLTGPTASGKSEIALKAAFGRPVEIVSADSMQVYRYMDIGTAKPTPQERRMVRHHLIDVCDPDQRFTVSQYQRLASQAIEEILARGHLPLIVGGTGFYIDALLQSFDLPEESSDGELRSMLAQRAANEGGHVLYRELLEVDPESGARIHPNDTRRIIRALEVYYTTGRPMSALMRKGEPRYSAVMLALDVDREVLYKRINERVDRQVADGLISEVAWLLERYGDRLTTARQALGYKEIIEYLEGRVSIDEALDTLKRNTRRYAKRQLTWFRRYSDLRWLPATTEEQVKVAIDSLKRIVEGIAGRSVE